jgi:hypothetical protein
MSFNRGAGLQASPLRVRANSKTSNKDQQPLGQTLRNRHSVYKTLIALFITLLIRLVTFSLLSALAR